MVEGTAIEVVGQAALGSVVANKVFVADLCKFQLAQHDLLAQLVHRSIDTQQEAEWGGWFWQSTTAHVSLMTSHVLLGLIVNRRPQHNQLVSHR
jgi:hypothetical protein